MSTPRRDMDHGALAGCVIFIVGLIVAIAGAVCIGTCDELPAGMHRASIVRSDTVMRPHVTSQTRTLDSLDSLWRVRR